MMAGRLPDMTYVVDDGGTIRSFHAPDPTLLFTDPDRFVNRHIDDILPPKAAEAVMAAIENAFRTGAGKSIPYAIDRPDGRRWFVVETILSDASRVTCTIRDVTSGCVPDGMADK